MATAVPSTSTTSPAAPPADRTNTTGVSPTTNKPVTLQKDGAGEDAPPPNKLAEYLAVGSSSPWPAWSMSALLMASLPTSSRLSMALYPTGLAPTWQVTPLAMVFGLSGYITSAGDYYNGSGTASAWSFIYLFLHGRDSWRHTFVRPPNTRGSLFPLSLSALALSNAVMHGYVYWSGFYRDPFLHDSSDSKS